MTYFKYKSLKSGKEYKKRHVLSRLPYEKRDKKKIKKKCIELAKRIAKEKANYICEKCGRSKMQGWRMHGAHIIPVEFGNTAADPDNILCLCAKCHSIGRESAHENPLEFSRWFEKKIPGRYDRLRLKARYKTKINWFDKYMVLKNWDR